MMRVIDSKVLQMNTSRTMIIVCVGAEMGKLFILLLGFCMLCIMPFHNNQLHGNWSKKKKKSTGMWMKNMENAR
jgi:hypothetical protein